MEQQRRTRKYRGRKAVPMQYRRKRSWKKPLVIIGGALILCAVAAVILIPRLLNDGESGEIVETAPPPADTVIHIVAGGDINITDESVAAGKTADGYDYQQVFKDVLPILASGDLTVLNFEGIISNGNDYGTETKNAPPELLTALKNAGVDILQTANSYSVFNGPASGGHLGMVSTIQGIKNAGMLPLGTYESKEAYNEAGGYSIWEVNGVKVAMMAFTKGMAGSGGIPDVSKGCFSLLYKDYDSSSESTYQKVDEEAITQVVRNAAAHEPDVMIAMVHWGSEKSDQISKTQEKICKILQTEGVDAIIGSHPHYVHKMKYDRETDQFVAWSMGDFFGDMTGTNYSVLLDLEITKDGKTGETKVTGFDYVPIFMHKDENGMRILRIKEAMEAYENRYLDRVTEETYNKMKNALELIKNRVERK